MSARIAARRFRPPRAHWRRLIVERICAIIALPGARRGQVQHEALYLLRVVATLTTSFDNFQVEAEIPLPRLGHDEVQFNIQVGDLENSSFPCLSPFVLRLDEFAADAADDVLQVGIAGVSDGILIVTSSTTDTHLLTLRRSVVQVQWQELVAGAALSGITAGPARELPWGAADDSLKHRPAVAIPRRWNEGMSSGEDHPVAIGTRAATAIRTIGASMCSRRRKINVLSSATGR
jgi:hypothetical protein